MNLVVILFILLILMIAILKPDSRIITICMMSIFVIMIAGTHDSYDYIQYCIMYSKAAAGMTRTVSGTWLLSECMRLGSIMGLEYDGFRLVVTIIESILIQSTIQRYCRYSAFAWVLFIIFPGWWLTTLFRHSIALTIIIFSLRYLIEDSKYNWLKYLGCVILAGTFHSAFWFFVILVLIKFFDVKTITIAGIVSIVVVFVSNQITIVNNIINMLKIEDDIAERIHEKKTSFLGLIKTIALNIPIILPGFLSKYIWTGKIRVGKIEKLDNKKSNDIIVVNFTKILSSFLFCISMSLISSLASRLCHFYSFYFILMMTKSLERYNRKLSGRISLEIMMIIIGILLTVFTCLESKTLYDLIIKAIWDTNTLLNL